MSRYAVLCSQHQWDWPANLPLLNAHRWLCATCQEQPGTTREPRSSLPLASFDSDKLGCRTRREYVQSSAEQPWSTSLDSTHSMTLLALTRSPSTLATVGTSSVVQTLGLPINYRSAPRENSGSANDIKAS